MSNMYEFINKTWNPLGGQCIHSCSYCYVEKMKRFPVMKEKYSGEPRLIESEFKKKFKPNETVFMVDCNDLFAANVPELMINKILEYCNKFKETTFYFQSKNPSRMLDFVGFYPDKSILCTTIETNVINKLMGNTPIINYRISAMNHLSYYYKTEITCEPLMNFNLSYMVDLLKFSKVSKINLGANSNKRIKLPEPSKDKVLQLISECEKFTKVYIKENLKRIIK